MDHILQVRAEQQSSQNLPDRGVKRFTRSADADTASRVTLAMALAAISFLTLFWSFSVAGSPSPTTLLPARLVAVIVGSIFTSKTALFALSNVIFALLAADCRCRFAATTASAGHVSSSSSGEPGGVLEKQERHHQVQVEQVEMEQCAVVLVQSCVPCYEIPDHDEQEGREDKSTMSVSMLPDEEEEELSELELVRLREEEEEEEDSVTLEESVDVEEERPTCEAAQGLDRLEISELNKRFDEFIRSRRIKWVNEEACLLLCEV